MRRTIGVGIAVAAAATLAGCSTTTTVGAGSPDVDAARRFDRHPLYWVGDRFEKWDLENIDLGSPGVFVTFSYGTCELDVPADGGCAVPLQIQIQPLCTHLAVVARAPIWQRRQVRGAPVGTIDSAPVLFTSRAQVKVYVGQGADPGLSMRALRALRSINEAPPVIDRDDRIPPAPRSVLDGTEPCV